MKRGLQCAAVSGLVFSALLADGYDCAGRDIQIEPNEGVSIAETARIYAKDAKNRNSEIRLNERLEVASEEEEWPGYMEWMVDAKKNVEDFKGYINSFSNSISKEGENLLYIDLNAKSKSATFYIYKKKF